MPKKKSNKEGVKYGLREQKTSHPNQWTGTPQQERWLLYYLDPKSKTFANPYESALEAGYSESYAMIIAAPSTNRLWVKEARNLVSMGPEHIAQLLQKEAVDPMNKAGDRIRAVELIAKLQGLFVEKSQTTVVNIEAALNDLK